MRPQSYEKCQTAGAVVYDFVRCRSVAGGRVCVCRGGVVGW